MSRAIKYQFWIISEKRMIDAIGFCFESDTQIRIWYRKMSSGDSLICNESFAVHDVAQRQFTGLFDKNGKEIYEGDIIRSFDSTGFAVKHKIEYSTQTSAFVAQYIPTPVILSESGISQKWIIEFSKEAIGNIYQHPDLLT